MDSSKRFLRYTWFVLIMVFLVILAGGVVRMTQSGMGCPDWPKCFGRWIPPVSADQLPADYEKYLSRQDIDHTFNVYHTWIEYINRLLGAILGIFIFIHFIWSFSRFRKTRPIITWLSFLLLLTVAFQGWLGKKVVDHNLAAVKITTHMLVALAIAAIPLLIIAKLKTEQRIRDNKLKWISILLLFLLLIQVVLGTQVREQVDEISKSLAYQQRDQWIGSLDNLFLVHRSFSWILFSCALVLAWRSLSHPLFRNHSYFIFAILVITIAVGIIMNFYQFPALAQPIHLLLASILVLSVFAFTLRLK